MIYLLSHLRHRRRRAVAVLAGVAMGAALFVALSALGDGFRDAARAPLAEVATDLQLTRPAEDAGAPPERGLRPPDGLAEFSPGELAAVADVPEVEGVAGSVLLWDFGSRQTVTVVGADPAADRIGPGLVLADNVVEGRAFDPGEEGVAAADMHYAAFYGLGVGSTVELGGEEMEIVGITEVADSGQAAVANIHIPIEQARDLAGMEEGEANQVHVALSDAGAAEAVADRIEERIGSVSTITEDSLVQVFGAVGQISARFSMLAAAIGLLGGAVLSWAAVRGLVRERAREIGLLQTTGWRRGHIARVFVTEAAILSTVGAGTGVLLGWGAAALLARLPVPDLAPSGAQSGHGGTEEHLGRVDPVTLPVAVDPRDALLAVAVAVTAGLLAGWTASRRATAADPVRNLRAS